MKRTPTIAVRRRGLRSDTVVEVDVQAPAIWARRGPAPLMERSHRHDDLELNYVVRGRLDYLFGGSPMTVQAGEIAVFWGATPHRLIEDCADQLGDNCWVHIPLGTVLGCLIIGVLNNGLVLLEVSPFWQQVIKGFVILAAVALDKMSSSED